MQVVLTYDRDVGGTDNDVISLYVIGNLVDTVTVDNIEDWAGGDAAALAKIGGGSVATDGVGLTGTDDNYDGEISIMRYYPKTLDSTEVLNNYNAIVDPFSSKTTVEDRVSGDGDDGLDTIDNIFGFDGQDILQGGAGNDNLTGGNGADIFVALSDIDDGSDVILDFTTEDKVLFDAAATNVTDFADLSTNHLIGNTGSATAHDVEIQYGASSITLEGITFLLDASHFDFI